VNRCPKCGDPLFKLVCERCARAKSEAALAAQQQQYAHFITGGRAPLILIEMFPEGSHDGKKWHIQRLGADRRHAMCSAYFKTMAGARPVPLYRLAEFKPMCESCRQILQGLVDSVAVSPHLSERESA
jgi:hypothetical protein